MSHGIKHFVCGKLTRTLVPASTGNIFIFHSYSPFFNVDCFQWSRISDMVHRREFKWLLCCDGFSWYYSPSLVLWAQISSQSLRRSHSRRWCKICENNFLLIFMTVWLIPEHCVPSQRQLFRNWFHRHHRSHVVRHNREAAENLHRMSSSRQYC